MENPHKKKNWNEKYMSSMYYMSFERKHYKISNLDGEETYIIGYNWYKDEPFIPNADFRINEGNATIDEISNNLRYFYKKYFMDYKTDIVHKGWSIIDSLISLRQKLHYTYDINEYSVSKQQLIELEQSLSNDDNKEILKWLKIYGMPFLGEKTNNSDMMLGIPPFEYGFKNDFLTCHKKNACICRLGSFLVALNTLMKTFINYLNYAFQHDNLENLEFSNDDYDNYDKNDTEAYIRTALSSISNKAIINLDEILAEYELPRFKGCCETIISLAMYQLAIIASSKKLSTAKKCSLCEDIFIPTRRSRYYCKTCSRQKKYNKKD